MSLPPDVERRLERMERLAILLDSAVRVPGVDVRVGLDALIGLIPGIGDTLSLAISSFIWNEARRAGVGRLTLARMGLNSGLDWLIGLVPLLGDLLDVGYRSNARNARLAAEDLRRQARRGGGWDGR